ncbi:MAG: cytochrome c [Hyphomicrobiaceae bacterium]
MADSRRGRVAVAATWWLATFVLATLAVSLPATAGELPAPGTLQTELAGIRTVEVFEPHLAAGGSKTRVAYVGWPAETALDHLLGPGWRASGGEIEARALDGYVSRVPVSRLLRQRAFLVVARADGAPFTVDNIAQGERGVPLAPYYLVWDNVGDPALLADGASYWPYQIASLGVVASDLERLLPAGLGGRFREEAELAQRLCLACHRLAGTGGDKHPIDLAERVRDMQAEAFTRWLLEPAKVRPGTTMPAIEPSRQEPERKQLAERLFTYLRAMPVSPVR